MVEAKVCSQVGAGAGQKGVKRESLPKDSGFGSGSGSADNMW